MTQLLAYLFGDYSRERREAGYGQTVSNKLTQEQMIALELEKLRPAIEAYGFFVRESDGITVFVANDGTMYSQLCKMGADKTGKRSPYFGYGIAWAFPPSTTSHHIAEDVAVLIKAACLDFTKELENHAQEHSPR